MAKVSIEIEGYQKSIHVDAFEGNVHLDAREISEGYPSLEPHEARALAAALIAQAREMERT